MITAEQIVNNYTSKNLKEYVKILIIQDKNKIDILVVKFSDYLIQKRPRLKKENLKNIANFLTDIPLESAYIFVLKSDLNKANSKEFQYIFTMNERLLFHEKEYKEKFYEPAREIIFKYNEFKQKEKWLNRLQKGR